MIALLKSIDSKIIEAVQAAYLWLYDRTGVFLATLTFATIVADVFCGGLTTGLRLFDFLFLGYVGLTSAVRYHMQSTGQIAALNLGQLELRNSTIVRPIFIALMLSIIVIATYKSDAWKVASALLALLWQYLFCILIRDREPKDFFEQRKLAGSEA